MYCLCYQIILILNLVKILTGELSLEIFKNTQGIEVPIGDTLVEIAGANLSLTCNLLSSSSDPAAYDSEISWGRKRRYMQFDNIGDLKKLAEDPRKVLHQLLNKSEPNYAILNFRSLHPEDAGKYFCMSLKYNLFKIVELEVNVVKDDLLKYFHVYKVPQLDFKFVKDNGPVAFPNFLCTEDMFICGLGGSCIDYQYVCDNIKDCADGSDEDYFCGMHTCEGKKRCSNGRCISQSLCCDKYKDLDCDVNVRPACCFENDGNEVPSFMPPHITNLDFSDNFNTKYDLIPSDDEEEDENRWHFITEESSKNETIWIVVPCAIVIVAFIICIAIRQVRSRNPSIPRQMSHMPGSTRTTSVSGSLQSNSTRISSRSASRDLQTVATSHNLNRYLDLPPSYDEVVGNAPPSAPPYYSGLA